MAPMMSKVAWLVR